MSTPVTVAPASHAPAAPSADAGNQPQPGPFLSYSRRDRAFAERLYDALRARNRDAWVDLEGIEPSEEWLQKLNRAIDAAQAFVFVISPDSVVSRHCEDEIRRAVEGQKKLIPVLRREVDPAHIPEALARIQWISFLDDVGFGESVDDLVRALDTDLEWNARHTRLLVRAREWTGVRDRSLLLRGRDLKEAEQWLLDAATIKDQKPNALQTEFIGASVAAEKRFRNRLLASVSGAAVIAITLAGIAVYQRNVAQENEQQALTRQLAAQAQGMVNTDLALSLLLSASAYQRRPAFEARQAMFAAIHHRPYLSRYLHGHNARLHQLTFDESGSRLASSATDGRVIVWDLQTSQATFTLQIAAGRPPAIALHSAAGALATAAASSIVHLRSPATGALVDSLLLQGAAPAAQLAFSFDGRLLAAGAMDGSVTVWTVATRRPLCTAPSTDGGHVTGLRFDSTGTALAAIDYAGAARLLALPDCRVSGRARTDMGAEHAAFSSDLVTAAAFTTGPPDLALLDLRAGSTVTHSLVSTDFLLAAAAIQGDTFALASAAGAVEVWSARQDRTVRTLRGHRADVTALAAHAATRRVASGSINGEVILWDLEQVAPLEPVRTLPLRARHVLFTADARALLTVDSAGGARLWDVATLQPAADLPAWPAGDAIAVNTQAELVAVLERGVLRVRGWRDAAIIDSTTLAGYSETQLAFSPDGNHLAYIENGTVMLRDVRTHTVDTIAASAEGTAALAFAEQGESLLYVAVRDTIVSYDPDTGSATRVIVPGEHHPVQSLARHRDLLASGGQLYDGKVLLFDAPAGRIVRTMPSGDLLAIGRVFFSADGGTLGAIVRDNEELLLWDVGTGQLTLGPIRLGGRVGVTISATLSADGAMLATAERDGVVVRELGPARWIGAICRGVNRDLTEQEWRTYVGDYPYQPTCAEISGAAPSGPARPADRRQ